MTYKKREKITQLDKIIIDLFDAGPSRVREICKRTGLKMSIASHYTSKMNKMGLTQRNGEGYSLTELGRSRMGDILPKLEKMDATPERKFVDEGWKPPVFVPNRYEPLPVPKPVKYEDTHPSELPHDAIKAEGEKAAEVIAAIDAYTGERILREQDEVAINWEAEFIKLSHSLVEAIGRLESRA